jgi:hypothetical protein
LTLNSTGLYIFGVRPSSTVSLDSHAAATLRYIRTSMEAAGKVTVSGTASITVGCVGLPATALSATPGLRPHWLLVWVGAAIAAGSLGGALMARQVAQQGFTLFGAPVRKFLLCLLPGIFGGAFMTAVLWQAGNPHAIPGTWLLLYGCALVSASAPTTRTVGLLGVLFALLGIGAFLVPEGLQNLVLGAGFGGLHTGFGILMRQESHGSET